MSLYYPTLSPVGTAFSLGSKLIRRRHPLGWSPPLDLPVLLSTPEPQSSWDQLRPETHWWVDERRFICIDRRLLPDQVGFGRFDELGAMEEFPEDEEDGRDDEHRVVDEEGLDGPGRECGVAVAEDNHDHPGESDICLGIC
jgi:hypothetical protein